MTKIVIRPTKAEDFLEFAGRLPPFTSYCETGLIDDKVAGIGGYAVLPNGKLMVGLMIQPWVRDKYPVSLHRIAIDYFRRLKADGKVKELIALLDPSVEAAPQWIERLGFKKTTINGKELYRWAADCSNH